MEEKKVLTKKDRNRDSIYSNVTFERSESAARPLKKKKPQQGMKRKGWTQRSIRVTKSNEQKRSGTPEGPKNWWLHLLRLSLSSCIHYISSTLYNLQFHNSGDRARDAKSTGRAIILVDRDGEMSVRFGTIFGGIRDVFFAPPSERGRASKMDCWLNEFSCFSFSYINIIFSSLFFSSPQMFEF